MLVLCANSHVRGCRGQEGALRALESSEDSIPIQAQAVLSPVSGDGGREEPRDRVWGHEQGLKLRPAVTAP